MAGKSGMLGKMPLELGQESGRNTDPVKIGRKLQSEADLRVARNDWNAGSWYLGRDSNPYACDSGRF